MEPAHWDRRRLFMVNGALHAARLAFPFVLGFRVRPGLPLHVGGMVRATTCQRLDMIDYVALVRPGGFAGARARVQMLECRNGLVIAMRASLCRRWHNTERYCDGKEEPCRMPRQGALLREAQKGCNQSDQHHALDLRALGLFAHEPGGVGFAVAV